MIITRQQTGIMAQTAQKTGEEDKVAMTKVIVIPEHNEFVLRTSNGFPIGSRMLGPAPENGRDYPELTDRFGTKSEATIAAMHWNRYLAWAKLKMSKTKERISE